MALVYLLLAILLKANTIFGDEQHLNTSSSVKKTTLDPKRRNDLVDEAFTEQKDILLDMLEAKLKEVQNKKKKKSDHVETTDSKCDVLKNIDLKLKANGISAIGETETLLKFGKSGSGSLNLDANGISNIGKAHLDITLGEGTIHIPGLNNLLVGQSFLQNCDKEKENKLSRNADNADPKFIAFSESRKNNSNDTDANNNIDTYNAINGTENGDDIKARVTQIYQGKKSRNDGAAMPENNKTAGVATNLALENEIGTTLHI